VIIPRPSEKELTKFRRWLTDQVCLEELQPTSEWEIFRFKYEKGVLILYKNAAGQYSVNSNDVHTAFRCCMENNPFPWKIKPVNRNRTSQYKKSVRMRDGDECFYCGVDVEDEKNMTLEHLLSLAHGGRNRLENMAIAHKKCNEMAGKMSVVEKVKLRDRLRAENAK